MDKVTLERTELLHPALRAEAKEIYAEICERLTGRATCRFSHTLRTFAEQDALYTKRPKVTNAKAGQSYHNYGLAVDIVLIIDGKEASWDMKTDFDGDGLSDWQEVVYVFGLYGWEWGGNWKSFKDYPHFQKTFGLTISECLTRYNSKQLIAGTNYIRL